ncbi:hypothetical protein ACLOJK_023920 [Asimina triloba]
MIHERIRNRAKDYPIRDMIPVAYDVLKAGKVLRERKFRYLSMCNSRKFCPDIGDTVHVGPSGHKARLYAVLKFEGWRGTHFWKKTEVDDLVPPKVVASAAYVPAVAELCAQAGANLKHLGLKPGRAISRSGPKADNTRIPHTVFIVSMDHHVYNGVPKELRARGDGNGENLVVKRAQVRAIPGWMIEREVLSGSMETMGTIGGILWLYKNKSGRVG